MDKLRVSLVGLGHLGKIHLRLLSQNSSIELLGVYDIDVDLAKAQALLYNIRCFENLSDLISSSDAVFVIVPTLHHYSIGKDVLLGGCHLFIEKPVCSNVSESRLLLDLLRNTSGLKCQVGHIERYNPSILVSKNYDLHPKFIESHRMTEYRGRGIDVSVIHDLMIHDIDLALWLVDSKIKQIDASGVAVISNQIDLSNARLKFENGAVANLTASRLSATSMRKFRLFQQFCYMSLDLVSGAVEIFRLGKKEELEKNNSIAQMLGDIENTNNRIIYEKPEILQHNAMAVQQQSFIDCIINDSPPFCSLAEGTAALEVAEEIYRQVK